MVPNPDKIEETPENQIAEMVEEYTEEFNNLSSTIDQLDSYLDVLEQQSDRLYEKVAELLESNKEVKEKLVEDTELSDNIATGASTCTMENRCCEEFDQKVNISSNDQVSKDDDNSEKPNNEKRTHESKDV